MVLLHACVAVIKMNACMRGILYRLLWKRSISWKNIGCKCVDDSTAMVRKKALIMM